MVESPNFRVMILEDDHDLANQMRRIIESIGYQVQVYHESDGFIKQYAAFNPDVILLDINLENSSHDGLWVMRYLNTESQTTSKIIVISGLASTIQVAEIRSLGAYTFMEKGANFKLNQLLLNVENAAQHRRQEDENLHLHVENQNLKKQLIKRYPFLGDCQMIRDARQKLESWAKVDIGVVIVGESGTGKEIAAHYYYQLSPRFAKPFHTVNCSAFTGARLEAELFGNIKESDKGTDNNRIDHFERCDRGVLFLDDFNEISLSYLEKLYENISNKMIQNGDNPPRKVDTRLVITSSQELAKLIRPGRDDEDLYNLAAGNFIYLPPLRNRGDDIVTLMQYYLDLYAQKYPIQIRMDLHTFKDELLSYPWPGNIRELRNFCKHIILNETYLDEKIVAKYLSQKKAVYRICTTEQIKKYMETETIRNSVAAFEKDYLIYHLQMNGWKINETASEVGLERTTLYKKMKQYNITKEEKKPVIKNEK